MANDCAQLRAELAALRLEVSRLQSVDENSIINKAVTKAKEILKPEIAGVAAVAFGAVKQADLSIFLTKQLRPEVTQAVIQSRSAAKAAEFAQKLAKGAEIASEVASIKSGKAFIEASKAGAVSQVSLRTAAAAQNVAAATGATASRAITIATIAQGTATAANAFAASAIGKTILLAANVLSLAGSIAGLFSLYATLKIVFPRLDAHDAQLDAHNSQIARNSSEIYRVNEQVKKANYTAEVANAKADRNADEIYRTNIIAKEGKYLAEVANAKGNQALAKIPPVEEIAKTANYKADVGNSRAIQALTGLTAMQTLVDRLNAEVQAANGNATNAASKANTAIKDAQKATEEANIATGKANNAQKEIDLAKVRINQVGVKADDAFSKAVAIEPVANQAIQQVSQVRPISEQALTNAFNALNRVNTVEPVANNAFTATQLQQQQLTATKLEVGGLGRTSKIQDRKIIELDKRIDDFKPPTPEPDMGNQEVMEKLAQIGGAIGLLSLGVNNMPKNIAKSPEFQSSITNATINANCRTAQPGGCSAKAMDKSVSDGNNDLKKYLEGLLKAGNTALDLDTNLKVTKVLADTQKIRQATGSDEYPMILPKYLLDDFIDTPETILNQAAFNAWSLKQWDALIGLFPIKIERVDENGQKQMLKFENIAEAIAELTGLIAQVAFDADTAVNVSTRATGEAIGAKAAALQAGSYLKAIIDYMGFQGEPVSFDVPISVSPGAVGLDGKLQESELKDFLKPSTQKAIGFKNTDPVDQRLVLQRILQSGEISRAALFKPLKPNAEQNPLTGDAIKADKAADKKRIDDQWDAFKLRMEGHTAGTKVDIDDGTNPPEGTTP